MKGYMKLISAFPKKAIILIFPKFLKFKPIYHRYQKYELITKNNNNSNNKMIDVENKEM